MPKMGDKVCLNHTGVPAVSRCETCFKPLCGDCILEVGGGQFCSEKCAVNAMDKRGRIAVLEAVNQKSKAAAVMTNVIILLVLAGIAYGAYVYWQSKQNQTPMDKFRDEAHKTLKAAGKDIRSFKDSVTK